jgi:hypothetical protein
MTLVEPKHQDDVTITVSFDPKYVFDIYICQTQVLEICSENC